MKFLTVATTLLAGTVAARSSLHTSNDVSIADDNPLAVPGDNPLAHCANPKDDILDLKSVDLSPNPPKA